MAQRGPRGEGSWISRHSAHEGGKVITLTHRLPLPPGISWYSFLEAESTPGTWTCRMPRKKSRVTRPGIDPGTFQLVAQCLNHYATSGPTIVYKLMVILLNVLTILREVFNKEIYNNDYLCHRLKLNTPPENGRKRPKYVGGLQEVCMFLYLTTGQLLESTRVGILILVTLL